jgi:hypothetical protein
MYGGGEWDERGGNHGAITQDLKDTFKGTLLNKL